MARKPLYRTNEFPYHVTARCNNQEWYFLDKNICWDIFKSEIKKVSERYNFETHAFTLMSNHFHWMLSTPDANIDEGMKYFMTRTSHAIAKETGRKNRIYGARYKPTVILTQNHYESALKYVYLNPVKAKICENPFDYRWSTLVDKSVPIIDLSKFPLELDGKDLTAWLLASANEEFFETTEKALRRSIFEYARDPRTKLKNK